MSTKGRSNRSRKGSTTPPPPVVETGRAPSDPSAKTLAGPFAPSHETDDATTAPPSAVALGEGPASKKRPPRSRGSRPSVAPKAPKKDSTRPTSMAAARRSKAPPPVVDTQLALTSAPAPVVVESAPVAPAPQPGLVTPRELDRTHIDPAPPAGIEAGGWRAPEPHEAEEASDADDEKAADVAPARAAQPSSPDTDTDADDVSVPPAVEDLDHHFFAGAERPSQRPASLHDTFSDLETATPDPLLAHKMSPAVQQRRARLAKLVKAAVGIAATVCFVAAAVHFGTRRTEPVAAPTGDKPVALTAPQGPEQVETHAASAPANEPEGNEGVGAATEPAPAAVDSPKAEEAKADEPKTAELDPDLAKTEKQKAQQALERYDLKKAIELGEQSVAHNPQDAEAWLILGAAYQTKGQMADAKRCFKACIDEGKGPRRWECYQFPH